MSLTLNTRLGPYEILAPLGAGGMGEVYRAKDARLDRDVAIKVIAADQEPTAEQRQRFEAFCRSLSPTQLEALVPGSHWRAKDYVAHLATIDAPIGRDPNRPTRRAVNWCCGCSDRSWSRTAGARCSPMSWTISAL